MTDLPIKLAVCFLIIGLMTPLIVNSTENADREISLKDLREEADALKRTINGVYYSGTGSIMTIEMDLPTGQALMVGGAEPYVIRLMVDGSEVDRVYLDTPAVKVMNQAWIEGISVITVKCVNSEGEYGVEIST